MGWLARLLRRWGGEYFAHAALRRRARSGDPVALQTLARAALERGDEAEAEALLDEAFALSPDDPLKASLLVTRAALARRGERFEAARADLDEALRLVPDQPRALTNLAELELIHGRPQQALRLLDQALVKEPDLLPAQVNRVAALAETGQFEAARALGEKLLRRHPDVPELLLNTANALLQLGRGRKAVELLRKALTIKKDFPEAEYLLAVLVGDSFALAPALEYLEKRLAREGESLGLLVTLANGHQAAGHLSRAHELALRILAREPDHLSARLVLASVSSSSGHTEISDRLYGQLYEQARDLSGLASNWLFEGNYLPHLPPAELYERHRRWAERYAAGSPVSTPPPRARKRLPLRVGYVSGDLCRHPVGSLLLQILALHDRKTVQPIAFSTTLREDNMTRELKRHFAAWHDVFDEDEADLAQRIRDEGIDILVDLSGHTAFHRLTVFARRAAPVQVTWIGYFHSTGLAEIDYLLTDPHTSPPECGQYFSETPIYLGSTRFCFFPPPYAPPPAPAPTQRGLPFTFGCFNRLAKINDEVVEVWAEILRRAPGSRLWLKAGALKDPWVKADLAARFAACGIDCGRLTFSAGGPHGEMLEEFAMVDLCLDPFPFTGGATSLEAFWMGVPTLTVPGATMVSRQTHAMNINLGLDQQFSAAGVRDYIARAVALAADPRPLHALRTVLRSRMAESPLCDGERFTRRLETFYRAAHEAALEGRRLPAYYAVE
ncbi:tetratricopeptide repeat protein [Pelomicrobium methylotrophicum]|uniref:protein O-GlcNAc transferase n=1 Tax=Pelomicrobium methylotrophicum TaxID=2602750 RepID=A0A5C7F2J8_9PROT|nr:tetratricopeptide repeat protein [Pelomicrobium methylotrophicum]TXF13727.1 tetratricopeptide repeat protein [Pelomicrobium methylotrophicum]